MNTQDQPWIDTHCHLADEGMIGDVAGILERAREAGVGGVVAVGDTLERSERVIRLAQEHRGVVAAGGLHPHHAGEWSPEVERSLRSLLDEHHTAGGGPLVAVGEIGLDFYYDFASREAQRTMFLRQAALARECGLPVILHCRDAWDVLLDLIEAEDIGANGGILHCFSGTYEQGRRAMDCGLHLGVGGILTFKRSEAIREVVVRLGLERLVLETDAPYLAPMPRRGKPNEPALMVHTAECLAEIFSIGLDELRSILHRNTLAALRCDAGIFG